MIKVNLPADSDQAGGYGPGEQIFYDTTGIEGWLATYRAVNGRAGVPAYWDVWCPKFDIGIKKFYSIEEAKAEMMRLAMIVRLTK